MQLDNGVHGLLIYDPLSDPKSNEVKAARRTADGDRSDDIEDTCGVAVALPFGSFSDPDELQVWPWRQMSSDAVCTGVLRSWAIVVW